MKAVGRREGEGDDIRKEGADYRASRRDYVSQVSAI